MLSPDDWSRLDAVLDAALDLAPEARAAFLDAQDLPPGLRARAEAMLAADDAEASILDDPGRMGSLMEAAEADAETVPPGTEIGPYRVIRELGRGGMGTVVLAKRADGAFEKQVALKLVRPGVAPGLLARFRAERRILARLEHPGIARLLDGGRTDDGRPYLAMEYVEGEPITAYADRQRLGIEARLALFEQVCDAVAYAHRQLVVHRDLKPSNILVASGEVSSEFRVPKSGSSASGARGERGGGEEKPGTAAGARVKLLDFGIAKLLDAEGEHSIIETAPEQRLLTPAYAAPEQVRGEPPSTATDVYALGVLLYELLTGRRPYRLPEKSRRAVERAILEDEPTRPSTAITTASGADADGPSPEAITASRGTEVRRLRKRLAGDLDQIVLAALRKEPERRYEGAAALGADVRRHLDGLPVEARPDSAAYRMSRFVRRHRAGVGAAGVALLALIVGLGAALWQADVASGERDAAAQARDEAQAVAAFMSDLFEGAKPRTALGETVTARAILDQGASEIRSDLTRHPSTRAALLLEMGRAYVAIGDYARADTLLQEALRLRQRLSRAASGGAASGGAASGGAASGARGGGNALGLAAAHYHLGAVQDVQEDYDEAEANYVAAVETFRRALDGLDHRGLAEALADLGTLRAWSRGEADAAVSLLDESRAMYRRLWRADTTDAELRDMVAYSTGSLGIVRQEQGDPEAAEALYREAIAFLRARGAGESPTLLDNQYMLATLLAETDRAPEAEAVFREIVPIEARVMGPEHPAHASTLATLAGLVRRGGKHTEAVGLLRRAMRIRESALGADHHSTLSAKYRLGRSLREAGRVDSARVVLTQALAACRRTASCAQEDNRDADFLAPLLVETARASGATAQSRRLAQEARDRFRANDDAEGVASAEAALREVGR